MALQGVTRQQEISRTRLLRDTRRLSEQIFDLLGSLEAVICALALTHDLLPGSPGTETPDPAIPLDYQLSSSEQPIRRTLSNSFGFGGTNATAVFKRV